ncbi:MAG: zinc ribbon domain-containing protein, partial [Alphaproteobacteria bacterium]
MTGPASASDRISPCCYQHAVTPDAVFCGECGKPLLRCMAYQECGGLVGDDGCCSVCVRPQLFLDRDAVTDVKAGGVLMLPLVFYNASSIARPLFVTDVWIRERDGPRRRIELPWKRLDAGGSNRLSIQTGVLEQQGRHGIEITFAAATNYFIREEKFAFTSSLGLEAESGGSLVINQTINTSGVGAGADTVYAPIRLETVGTTGRKPENAGKAAELGLQRADNFEAAMGIRGYTEGSLKGSVVSRGARIVWKGFGEATPTPGPITTQESILALGRGKTVAEGGDNHLQLLAIGADGKLNEQLSQAISRRHIELFIQSGRLCARVTGAAGIKIGDHKHGADDAIAVIDHGDVIKVLPKFPEAIGLQVRMRANYGQIDEITITRVPALP